jgi:hypothetical protein
MLGHRLKKLPTLRQPGQFAYDVGAVRKWMTSNRPTHRARRAATFAKSNHGYRLEPVDHVEWGVLLSLYHRLARS